MNWIMPNQSGKLAVCTTEALRSQRKDFLVCRRGADRLKPSVWNEFPWPKAREFMENRYLPPARQKPLRRGEGPILHEDISLSVLRVSNEHPTSRCEWVVNMARDVNYMAVSVITYSTYLTHLTIF